MIISIADGKWTNTIHDQSKKIKNYLFYYLIIIVVFLSLPPDNMPPQPPTSFGHPPQPQPLPAALSRILNAANSPVPVAKIANIAIVFSKCINC